MLAIYSGYRAAESTASPERRDNARRAAKGFKTCAVRDHRGDTGRFGRLDHIFDLGTRRARQRFVNKNNGALSRPDARTGTIEFGLTMLSDRPDPRPLLSRGKGGQ